MSFIEARVITEKSHLSVIEASELLIRVAKGDPFVYDYVATVGDIDTFWLDSSLIHYERHAKDMQTASGVASKIQIRNCEFLGNVNFTHAMQREALDLCDCIFWHEARFK